MGPGFRVQGIFQKHPGYRDVAGPEVNGVTLVITLLLHSCLCHVEEIVERIRQLLCTKRE